MMSGKKEKEKRREKGRLTTGGAQHENCSAGQALGEEGESITVGVSVYVPLDNKVLLGAMLQ